MRVMVSEITSNSIVCSKDSLQTLIKALHYCPLVRGTTSHQCVLLTKGPVMQIWSLNSIMNPVDNEVSMFIKPPTQQSWRGYTGFTLSVCLPVHLVICGQNRVRSVSSTILAGSISYLHILSTNFRRCVACHKILAISLNFHLCLVWLGIQYESIVWVIMGWRGILRIQAF